MRPMPKVGDIWECPATGKRFHIDKIQEVKNGWFIWWGLSYIEFGEGQPHYWPKSRWPPLELSFNRDPQRFVLVEMGE